MDADKMIEILTKGPPKGIEQVRREMWLSLKMEDQDVLNFVVAQLHGTLAALIEQHYGCSHEAALAIATLQTKEIIEQEKADKASGMNPFYLSFYKTPPYNKSGPMN